MASTATPAESKVPEIRFIVDLFIESLRHV